MPDTFSKTDGDAFTPPSLAHLQSPPIFYIRSGGYRDRRKFQSRLIREGLVYHSTQAFRDELLKALRQFWDVPTFEEQEGRLLSFWSAADEHEKASIGVVDPKPFEHPDAKAIEELTARVTADWEPLRHMASDVIAFQSESPIMALATLVTGWENLDADYARDLDAYIGSASMDAMEAVQAALRSIETDPVHKDDPAIVPGLAWMQTLMEAGRRMYSNRPVVKRAA
jgi:hypothetical protein